MSIFHRIKFRTMKKIFLFSLMIAYSAFLFAQKTQVKDADLSLKPVEGDMGITVGFQGLSVVNFTSNFSNGSTVLFRYYLRNDLALRTRINLTLNSSTNNQTDTS